MNQQQVLSLVRWFIATFGPILVSHGYISSSNLEMAAGALVSLIPLIWGIVNNTQGNAVAIVDAIAKQPFSAVQGVVTTNDAAGIALASSLPGNTTAPAGTVQASDIAK